MFYKVQINVTVRNKDMHTLRYFRCSEGKTRGESLVLKLLGGGYLSRLGSETFVRPAYIHSSIFTFL